MRLSKKSWAVAIAGVALVASGTYGAVMFTPAMVTAPVASPGAQWFNHTMLIDPNSIANNGYGDQIAWISEGRDGQSHFAEIAIWVSPTNPSIAVCNNLIGPSPVLGVVLSQGIPGNPTVGWQSPGTGYLLCSFIYRPTDDPLNPGWGMLPGGQTQVHDDAATVHAAAEAFRAFRDAVAAGGPNPLPWMQIVVAALPLGGVNNPVPGEFYQFRVAQ